MHSLNKHCGRQNPQHSHHNHPHSSLTSQPSSLLTHITTILTQSRRSLSFLARLISTLGVSVSIRFTPGVNVCIAFTLGVSVGMEPLPSPPTCRLFAGRRQAWRKPRGWARGCERRWQETAMAEGGRGRWSEDRTNGDGGGHGDDDGDGGGHGDGDGGGESSRELTPVFINLMLAARRRWSDG